MCVTFLTKHLHAPFPRKFNWQAWGGKDGNWAAAQSALLVRAKANSAAAKGAYKGEEGATAAAASNFVAKHAY